MTAGFSDETFEFAQGSVYGFRTWYMVGGDLVGHYDCSWLVPTMNARCGRPSHRLCLEDIVPHPEDIVPHPECTCGIYAFWSPYRFSGYKRSFTELKIPVGGVIEGSGRTIIGDLGFRSARAQIKALCFDSNLIPIYEIFGVTWSKSRLKVIADSFGVPFYESNQDMIAEHPLTTDYLTEEHSSSTEEFQ